MPTEKEKQNWNEWSLKVFQELVTLNSRTEKLNSSLDERYDSIIEKIDRINELLNGNGSPEKGLIIRVDRLEQNETRRLWLTRATMTTCIAAVITTIATWLRN